MTYTDIQNCLKSIFIMKYNRINRMGYVFANNVFYYQEYRLRIIKLFY